MQPQLKLSSLVCAFARAGDVLQIDNGRYILVITRDRHTGNCFTYTPCNFDGSLTVKKYKQSAANYLSSSVMLDFRSEVRLVNSVELESRTVVHNGQSYTWHLTGDAAIDAHMSHLDDRYSLFTAASSEFERARYNKLEDSNYHTENGAMVSMFCDDYFMKVKGA